MPAACSTRSDELGWAGHDLVGRAGRGTSRRGGHVAGRGRPVAGGALGAGPGAVLAADDEHALARARRHVGQGVVQHLLLRDADFVAQGARRR